MRTQCIFRMQRSLYERPVHQCRQLNILFRKFDLFEFPVPIEMPIVLHEKVAKSPSPLLQPCQRRPRTTSTSPTTSQKQSKMRYNSQEIRTNLFSGKSTILQINCSPFSTDISYSHSCSSSRRKTCTRNRSSYRQNTTC